jgi:hypothetical protein
MTKRNMMMRLLTTIIFTLILASCAEKKTTGAGFKVTLGAAALSGANANGGLIIWGHNKSNQDRFAKILTPPYSNLQLELNNGDWDFSAIAWHKASGSTLNLSGLVKCGVSLGNKILGVDTNISLELANANCVAPHLGNNAADTNSANRFVYNNGVNNQFSTIKMYACGHFNKIDASVNGNVTLNANNCASLEDVATIYDDVLNTEVQFKPYYKIKLIEYFKPGPGQHSIGPNTISSGCLGGGSNGYSTTGAVAVLKQAWAIAETASATNVVNIPWGGPGRGMATKIEAYSDSSCNNLKNDSIYFDGLLQPNNSRIDKIVKIGVGNSGYLFLAANENGAGYTPFWSILPNIKCFDASAATSCLPYDDFSGELFAGDVHHSPNYSSTLVFNGSLNSNNQCVLGTPPPPSPSLPSGVSLGTPTFSLPGAGPNGGGVCTVNLNISHNAVLDNTSRTVSVIFSQSATNPETISQPFNLSSILNQARDLSIPAPSGATDCSVGSVSNWSTVLANAPIVINKVFDSVNKRCNFKLINVNQDSGPKSSWNTGVYPQFTITWSGGPAATNYYFNFNSTSSTDANKRKSAIEIKRIAHSLIGYGQGFENQKEPHNQTSNWGDNNTWQGKLLDLKRMLGASDFGGILGKKFKTCSQLSNAIGTSHVVNFIDENNNLSNLKFDIKIGSINLASFQGAGSGSFPLRVELYKNNILEMILETNCTETSNPIYYFEEMREETENSEDTKKHRKYFIKAQNQALTSSGYNSSSGDVEIELIEMDERVQSDVFFSKENLVAKLSLESVSGNKLIKLTSVNSRRESKKISSSNYSHYFSSTRMGGTIIPKSAGASSLFFDVLQAQIINDSYFAFPNTLVAPLHGSDSYRHTKTTIGLGDVAEYNVCTQLATFSNNACTAPSTQSTSLSTGFTMASFWWGNSPQIIPLNHDFVATGDELNNSDLEYYFFPDFN